MNNINFAIKLGMLRLEHFLKIATFIRPTTVANPYVDILFNDKTLKKKTIKCSNYGTLKKYIYLN